MAAIDYTIAIADIDRALTAYQQVVRQTGSEQLGQWPQAGKQQLLSDLLSCAQRYAVHGSAQSKTAEEAYKKHGRTNPSLLPIVAGLLSSIRSEFKRGGTYGLIELVHADMFSDFLDMADYLEAENYKDAAAVIAGTVLETHLKKLCEKCGISIRLPNGKGKKADQLNADLAGSGVYSKNDQKSVTADLGLRNSAAHGEYAEYTREQVRVLLRSIRDFVGRHPA